MKAHEKFTVTSLYVENLLKNTYAYGDHELPDNIPIVPIRTTMQSYMELPPELAAQRTAQLEQLTLIEEQVGPVVVHADKGLHQASPKTVERAVPVGDQAKNQQPGNRDAASTARKRHRSANDDEDWEPQHISKKAPVVASSAEPRPTRVRKPSSRLKDYVVTIVTTQRVEDVPIPTSYKQAARSKRWHGWKQAMQAEMDSQRQHGTWILVPRTESKGKTCDFLQVGVCT